MAAKTPVFFLSHGGPNIMYDINHPVYSKLQDIGKVITTRVKPKAVVVFSAHWQAGGDNKIQVNTKEDTDLIYDFYGFPEHYYKGILPSREPIVLEKARMLTNRPEKYPSVGSKAVAAQVMDALRFNNIEVEAVERGLDHGVWASFKVAFDPEENPLSAPIVQVSLFSSEDPNQHYNLGRAVANLRSQNIAIIVSGMAVHNLRDFRFSTGTSRPMPYTSSFDEALKDAATSLPAKREQKMAKLLQRRDARQAHPSFDHLLPIFVGAGAAGDDVGERLWTLEEGSMSWAQYRFGELPTN